jgi:class 3 adenylate cyclase
VLTTQAFRDLFTAEALRAGEQMSVGSLAILFTDLCNSTRLYRRIGDAPEVGRVLTHCDVLRDAIAAEEGAMVKTIGDAVMAVFRSPAAALRAILAAQHRLAESDAAHPDGPLILKAGVHYGPCIAVTLNERLDYFGSTVNIAARLGGLSAGNDVVISDAVRSDPEVAALLSGGYSPQAFEAMLRGFDEERFALWRVCAAPAPKPS